MKRRQFLVDLAQTLAVVATMRQPMSVYNLEIPPQASTITLFLSGDVMTGRGIDQVLPFPVKPHLHEPYVNNAKRYVDIAEQLNGPIATPVTFDYIWGDALQALRHFTPV